MPELPEVETVRMGLEPVMCGIRIGQVDVNRPNLRWPFPSDMAARLTGARVLALRRRSKYILVDLDTGETLIIHLGMSGRMLVSYPPHPKFQKHDHVVIHMDSGGRVTFNDARRFGAMDLAPTARVEAHKMLVNLGPEPLSNMFNETYLADSLKSRKSPIKSALLDQRIIAGLGNIYVCEVLHRTKISPKRRACEVSRRKVNLLVPAIRDVLNDAIASGGSSLRDHRQTTGELGYFQHSFRVYDRAGEPCPTPNCTGNIVRIVQAGRSSFYCPRCQR